MESSAAHDVVVIGGGAAGLSAALTLARARRSVLVVDDGAPRNAPSDGVHNYLGAEGTPPAELAARGRREAAGYGAAFRSGRATSATAHDGGFTVTLADSTAVTARRLLVATGLTDELPAVEGVAQRWGTTVLHCPYCHGWEVRDRTVAVLATGPTAVHQAQLFRQWTPDVVLLRHTAAEPGPDARRALAARGIRVVDGEVTALDTVDGRTVVHLRSGGVVRCDAVVVGPRFTARSEVLASLGIEPVEQEQGGHVVGAVFAAGPTGESEVPGVYLAGNVADLHAGVVNAAAAGFSVATRINFSLVEEDVARATAAAPGGTMPATEDADGAPRPAQEFWEEMYGRPGRRWSGAVNPVLADVVGPLPAGDALDLGCGEGGDAVWLASRGWRVTAVDVSPTALARTAEHAAERGVGDRVRTAHHDLSVSIPDGDVDLVSAQFLQSPLELPRAALLRRIAARVRPGGLLLVVDHGSVPPWAWAHHDHVFPTPVEIADEIALDPAVWKRERVEARERSVTGPDGAQATVLDCVVALRRVT